METYTVVDYHTAGEPFRIVETLPVKIEGIDVPSRRTFAQESPEIQRIRQLLCFEPRGHADMYGGFITPPNDQGAHFGVLFWHKDGFSTACGHGTIALGVWAIESGRVSVDPSGTTEVVIDVPSGRVTARVHTDVKGQVTSVDFVSVPSYLIKTKVPVKTSLGSLTVDVSYGGAIYAQLDAASVGLEVAPKDYQAIIAIGREIKWLLNESDVAKHPRDPRLSGIYGTIIYEQLEPSSGGDVCQRNATVFADGEVDRSPCGSGTAARVATLVAQGELKVGETLSHSSLVGSHFTAKAVERTVAEGIDAVVPEVTGMAYKTAEIKLTIDPRDYITPGFVLR